MNQYHVVMEAAPQFWQGPRGLSAIYMHATNSAAMVPLNAVAHYEPTTAPIAVARTKRAHFARKLLEETALPMTEVAHAAGFASLRRFSDAVRGACESTRRVLRRA